MLRGCHDFGMQLFIDTNVYLSFFHFAKDDLEELRKLVVLVKKSEVTLLLPEQVFEEFWRNRDIKIADALKQIAKGPATYDYPRLLHDFAEHADIRELRAAIASRHAVLMAKAEDSARRKTFLADSVVGELFSAAKRITITKDHVDRAVRRGQLGSPPGKKDSIGDAVNWEALLAEADGGEDLHFITEDKDWLSPLGPDLFSSYLADEWREAMNAEIVYYPRLSQFFQSNFPDIKVAAELEKELLIRDLTNSASFAETHRVISSLNRLSDFTSEQLNVIVAAYVSNHQIRGIIRDSDVSSFVKRVTEGREGDLDEDAITYVRRLLAPRVNPAFVDATEG